MWTATELPPQPGFAERVVGLPIRRAALATDAPPACRARLGLDPDLPTLLVRRLAGRPLDQRAPDGLAAADPDLFDGWQILHLAGAGDDDGVRRAYEGCGVRSIVMPFLDEMGLAWGAAVGSR